MELVRRTIERYVPLRDTEWQRIAPHWTEHAFSRGAFVSAVGQVEQRFYIVKSGVQRLSFPHDGQDICVGFAYDGSWSGDYASFVTRKPGQFDVVAITDSVLLGIRHEDLQRLYSELPIMDRFGRLIMEELLVGRGTREIEQLSLSAEDRYDASGGPQPAPVTVGTTEGHRQLFAHDTGDLQPVAAEALSRS
ncbi:MAG: cyclic nucleotide-binding domain-containing protein [Flavobacteriales bacterium]|nr:cyclic nucleotide-binding domain-containing protein [Flavobacteriales bacterium]